MDIKRTFDLPYDTPFMVVDLDQTKKNIARMQIIADKNGKKLRPHSKTHKIPELSKLQIEIGAVGVCVQKTAEAETMFLGGIKSLLLSNEVFGGKFLRLSKLTSLGADLTVAVDNVPSVSQFAETCKNYSVEGNVLIDINTGMNRCGIEPEHTDRILEAIRKHGSLNLIGIMAYDGHVNSPDIKEREEEVKREELILEPIVKKTKKYCSGDLVVSVGGTPTADIWAKSPISTELQPGTYVYYDMQRVRQNLCTIDEISMGVVSSSISESLGTRIVLDAGYKSVAINEGVYPTVVDENERKYQVLSMSEEHTVIKPIDKVSHLGEEFLLLPYHACPVSDLWDKTYVLGSTIQPYTLSISGRGKRE